MFRRNKFEISNEDVQKKKVIFYELSKEYFDNGLLREIYSSSMVSICNLANSMYLAFLFAAIDENGVVGVVADKDVLKTIIQNNNYVYKIVQSYIQSNDNKYFVELNDKLTETFMPIKEKRSAPGCESSNIDFELEEEIIRKYSEKK